MDFTEEVKEQVHLSVVIKQTKCIVNITKNRLPASLDQIVTPFHENLQKYKTIQTPPIFLYILSKLNSIDIEANFINSINTFRGWVC